MTSAALAGVTLLASVSVAASSAAASSRGPLSLETIAFASPHVDARGDWTVIGLEWTVRSSDPATETVSGFVHLQMLDDSPLSRLGQLYEIDYRYGETYWTKARYVSGTPQESTYHYDFVVPRYGKTGIARWAVNKFVLRDERGSELVLEGQELYPYNATLHASTLIDSTPPRISYYYVEPISSDRHFVYVKDRAGAVFLYLSLQDGESGVWKGSVTMTGPGGQSSTGDFEVVWFRGERRCGRYFGGDLNNPSCGPIVPIPMGAASGQWRVSEVLLIDNVGNRVSITDNNVDSVRVTSNEVVTAESFAANPNPVNNWAQDATTQLTMKVNGAQAGVSAIYADFDIFGCRQVSTTPILGADGTVSVPIRVPRGVARCDVEGVAILDGAGNLALYGVDYSAPNPGVRISRLPNTTPPTATEVSLTPTSVPRSQSGSTSPRVTIKVNAPIAPVQSYDLYLYDSSGRTVAQQFGGIGADTNGNITIYGYLPYFIEPGVYTYSFTLYDAGGLRTSYGPPNGLPMPGGPLQITITDN